MLLVVLVVVPASSHSKAGHRDLREQSKRGGGTLHVLNYLITLKFQIIDLSTCLNWNRDFYIDNRCI